MKRKIVTVFGSGRAARGSPDYERAYALGRAVASAGWDLCNGGYGGTMEAAARGAVEAGGHTIGVTCSVFRRSGPNPYIRQEIPTFYLLTRLDTLVRLGDAYVVLPGGTGTLLEIALVWELLNKRLLRKEAPFVLLGDFWTPVVSVIFREQPDALAPQVVREVDEVIASLRARWDQEGGAG